MSFRSALVCELILMSSVFKSIASISSMPCLLTDLITFKPIKDKCSPSSTPSFWLFRIHTTFVLLAIGMLKLSVLSIIIFDSLFNHIWYRIWVFGVNSLVSSGSWGHCSVPVTTTAGWGHGSPDGYRSTPPPRASSLSTGCWVLSKPCLSSTSSALSPPSSGGSASRAKPLVGLLSPFCHRINSRTLAMSELYQYSFMSFPETIFQRPCPN